ncbi:putative halogenase [Mycena olivaceomarginata]|nr:putative halogenase [Mycena olivaceomarginata]
MCPSPIVVGATLPSSTQILVIGAYTAAALAREGFQITLLEKEIFPRYHIGETMLDSFRLFLKFIEAEEKVKNFGFAVKIRTLPLEGKPSRGLLEAWSIYVFKLSADKLILEDPSGFRRPPLNHAAESGASPVAAERKSDQGSGEIKFSWLIDASGRTGIMSTRYLKNRKFTQNPALKNIVCWGYWKGAGMYMPGTNRENAPWFEALTDETGWVWFIPPHTGVVSVGVVLSETPNRIKKKAQAVDAKAHYLSQLQLTPGLLKLLGNAELGGIGDAGVTGAFRRTVHNHDHIQIDPLFSSGVHLAFTYALSGATTIAASIRSHCTEEEAIKFRNQKVGVSYTRFLIVVLGVYKQIHAQGSDVLFDIHEDNFDRPFDFTRPVIQGDADMAWETQIQQAIDFVGATPGVVGMDPAIKERLSKRLDPSLLAANGPFLLAEALAEVSGDDAEARELLQRMNSRKAIIWIYDWAENSKEDNLSGFAIVLGGIIGP